ncbi:uncharacterized protein METZ01_LOCUS408055, partial [marine metagenome]
RPNRSGPILGSGKSELTASPDGTGSSHL